MKMDELMQEVLAGCEGDMSDIVGREKGIGVADTPAPKGSRQEWRNIAVIDARQGCERLLLYWEVGG